MKLKDILKELENIRDNEKRVIYLKELLEEIDDKELIKDINKLIEELEEDLESKLDNVAFPVSRKREIELDDVEHDIETQETRVTRQVPVQPRISLQNIEEDKDIRYDFGAQTYQTSKPIVYQSNQDSFTTYESLALHEDIDITMIEKALFQEGRIEAGSGLSEFHKDQVQETVERFMPYASVEDRIKARDKVFDDLKSKEEKLKYIAKLR